MKQRGPYLLFTIPAVLALVGALSGCTAFPMRSQQVWRAASNHQYPSHPVGTPEFETAMDAYTGSVSHPGCAARLLQNGDEAYPAMLALIESARTRISFETYIIEDDVTTDTFFDALRAAADRGVEVRVLVDAAGFHRGLIARLNDLDHPRIQGRVFNPFFLSWTVIRGNNRDHRKILVVDGQHAVMGGINLSDIQRGDGVSGWRDTSLLVSGPAAADAEKVFAETWEQGGRAWVGRSLPMPILNPLKQVTDAPFAHAAQHNGKPLFAPPPYEAPTEPPNLEPDRLASIEPHCRDASVRVVASSPDTRNSPTYDMAILGVLGARERLDIACAYFVPPQNLRRALLAAAGRGVRVRLLLPGVTDVKFVREIGIRHYGELLEAGIEIYEWPHPILHAKTMVADGCWQVVGSANMDSRSYFLNYEACFVVTDAELAQRAHQAFEKDLEQAIPMTMEKWRQRGGKQRFTETVLVPIAGQY